jgi:hypothetical protein
MKLKQHLPLPHLLQRKVTGTGASPSLPWNTLLWFFLGLGIFFRIFHFFENRSLWLDEFYLNVSLIKLNFLQLATLPLYYEQKAPLGYLWAVRLAVMVFGKGEMALRLVSLLTGIAALFIFVPVSRYFLRPMGAAVAMGILALAHPLAFHSVEAKQYGVELFCTVAALYLYIRYHQRHAWRPLIGWGMGGAALIWFSYSSIFVLAGMAFGLCLFYLKRKDWKPLFMSMLPFSIWLISFAVNYLFFIQRHAESDWLVVWFQNREGFVPFPVSSLSEAKWFFQTPYRMLKYPLGLLWNFETLDHPIFRILLKLPLVPLACWAVGMAIFYRQDKKVLLVLTLPLILTFIASALKIYPFYERLLVFLAPFLIVFIARGCEWITHLLPAKRGWHLLIPFLLLAWPLGTAASTIVNPTLFGDYKKSYQREAMFYINDRFQEEDVVYVYWNMRHAYQFYKDAGCLKYQAIEGADVRFRAEGPEDYFLKLKPDFAQLAGNRRVWLVYNRLLMIDIGDYDNLPAWYFAANPAPERLIHSLFSSLGTEVDRYQEKDVTVSLFDLSNP